MAPIAFANGPETNSNQIFLLQSSNIMKSLSHKNRWSSRSPRYYDMFKSIPIQDIWSPESSIGKSLILWTIWGRGPKPGMDAPPRTVGRGRFPAPPRPVKMIKTTGKLRGKIKARISTFSNRGNKWWNNITTLNNAQSSLSIGYARESKKWKYLLIFLLTGHQTLFSKICQHMK